MKAVSSSFVFKVSLDISFIKYSDSLNDLVSFLNGARPFLNDTRSSYNFFTMSLS